MRIGPSVRVRFSSKKPGVLATRRQPSHSLAAASPSGLADVLVPATAAAILGGVSLAGGSGKPLGIAAGVLVLCVIRSGLNALGVSPYVHDVATGAVLLTVAILDAPGLMRRLASYRSSRPA